ncbi:MAG: MFS transporter [Reyranella sp.]|jgi:MFS family permease|uniref:MFS transporter n=1 Tax=Reyranella sp. TaxID=1929291 RepID=UPI0025F7F347|nr:MFS transporter [Reyranella sp.]MBR2820233.1 MFS transporter [Reyranella sp.]
MMLDLPRAAIVATAAIFGLTYSLTATVLALDLAQRGFDEGFIGANAAMHAVGVLAMAVLLPRWVARIGVRRSVVGALAAATLLMLAFPAAPFVWLWFPLRILLGAASEVLFVLSETWLNALTPEGSRARTMAIYTAALSTGFALGPLILSATGTAGVLPYAVGGALAAAAIPFVLSRRVEAPTFEAPLHGNPVQYVRLAPLAMGATVLNAAVETAGFTFLALYAIDLGWDQGRAAQLVSCMMVGAIVLQLPIGWLGDHMDRRRLVVGLAALSAVLALVWPWALQQHPFLIFALLFVWGGLFVGIYTIMLAIVGSRFAGSQLVGIYAGMGLMWGAGALLGPTLAGLALEINRHGLVYFVALACMLFIVLALRART